MKTAILVLAFAGMAVGGFFAVRGAPTLVGKLVRAFVIVVIFAMMVTPLVM